jgi:hypothetical protein
MDRNKHDITTLPHITRDESSDIPFEPVTLRDQFAMAALTGILANGEYIYRGDSKDSYELLVLKYAYKLSDAMMEARK